MPSLSSSSSSPSPSSSSSLISFCGRISLIGGRGRPFNQRKDAFMRMKGENIWIYRDEENSLLLMPQLSIRNMTMVKRKEDIFKMYFHDGAETVLRMRMERQIANVFGMLLSESWRRGEGEGMEEEGEWMVMTRGWTRRRRKRGENRETRREDWMNSLITISEKSIVIGEERGGREERIDMRKLLSCSSHFDVLDWYEGVRAEKEKEERQSVYSLEMTLSDQSSLFLDSADMRILSTLRSTLSSLIALPQTSLISCRLSEREIPIVIEEAVKYLNVERRLNTRGMYRISAKNVVKNRLVECMIHSPTTVFSSLDALKGEEDKGKEEGRDEVYLVCDGLRSFLRRMERPLIPEVLHLPLFDAMTESSPTLRLEKVLSVLHSRHFSSVHYHTLILLLDHLHEVAERSETNAMTEDNLARIVAPCFFSCETSCEVIDEITPRVKSTLFLIENSQLLSKEKYVEYKRNHVKMVKF